MYSQENQKGNFHIFKQANNYNELILKCIFLLFRSVTDAIAMLPPRPHRDRGWSTDGMALKEEQ